MKVKQLRWIALKILIPFSVSVLCCVCGLYRVFGVLSDVSPYRKHNREIYTAQHKPQNTPPYCVKTFWVITCSNKHWGSANLLFTALSRWWKFLIPMAEASLPVEKTLLSSPQGGTYFTLPQRGDGLIQAPKQNFNSKTSNCNPFVLPRCLSGDTQFQKLQWGMFPFKYVQILKLSTGECWMESVFIYHHSHRSSYGLYGTVGVWFLNEMLSTRRKC